MVIERLLPTGVPDLTFTPPGPALYLTDEMDSAEAIAPASDGRLLVGGLIDGAPALFRFLGDCAGAACKSCPSCMPHPNFCEQARRTRVRLASAPSAASDSVVWRWSGPASAQGIGDPADGYAVTLWDGCELVASAAIGAPPVDGDAQRWTIAPRRLTYEDAAFSLRLRTDVAGLTTVALRSTDGLTLRPPTGPLTIALASRRWRGACWQALFERGRASGGGTFRAESRR